MDAAISEFEQKLGIRPIFGGYHKTFGTKNALINLDHHMYLELLAADHTNATVAPPRWMGIDLLSKNQITRWALTSDHLEKDHAILKKYNSEMGKIQKGSRDSADGSLLQWKLIMPLSAPEVEIAPFMVDWSDTEKHPSELLPDMGCTLIELYATHSKPEIFTEMFKELDDVLRFEKASTTSLKLKLKTPRGIVEL